ncbi:hypothetical protein [Streptomyces flavofungini]|uniref:hypothetical protein n=1 Tax=Streptomyces flavofungini TaxID=68200 RepID=UPI0025AFFE1E|nr:hypothetical protein [Streptomyces flavofungini]WJV47834.1 hypothetical protein QUY26_21340 [Streptomyces flavofungini]
MSNEPYDPYQQYPQDPQQQYPPQPQPQQHQGQQQPYDPHYGQYAQYPQEPAAQQAYPQGQGEWGYQEPYAQQQYATQQWEGQTWETQVSAPLPAVDVTETAYLPPQAYAEPPQAYQGQAYQAQAYQAQASGPDHSGSYPQEPAPAPAPAGPAPVTKPESEPEAAPDTAGYGPATLTGNPRITDAQRARAEGRSPIIEPGMQPALLTALLGLLLAGGAAVGQYGLLVPLVILQGVTAAGWFRLNGMWPARQGIALAFLGGVAADAALLATGEGNAPAAILGTLGVWVLLVLVLQLRSRAGADERMYGLMATLASSALAIIAAGHLAAVDDAAVVGGVAVAAAVLARALPMPTPASVVVALLAAAGAGIAVGGATDLGSEGALLGLAAGVCAVIGHRVASYDYPSRFVHFTAGVALPLAVAAPAVYLLGRALG